MPDIPVIERLEDWFDAVVTPGTPAGNSRFADVGAGLPHFSPGVDFELPSGTPESRAEVLAAVLHAAQVKRPLLWIEAGADPTLIDALPGVFSVALPGADPAWIGRADVTAEPEAAEAAVLEKLRAGLALGKRLNILVLYGDLYTHVRSMRENIQAYARFSRHNVVYMPAAKTMPSLDERARMFDDYDGAWPQAFDLDIYDVVIWHYVLPAYRIPGHWEAKYLADQVEQRLARYDGLKVLFVQDEYDHTQTIWQSMRRAGINLMMTCVPPEGIAYAYPPSEVPGVEFIQVLTGYAQIPGEFDPFVTPMAERITRLAYRGRELPFRYGNLTREKYEIGVRMEAMAADRGVPVDIDVREERRIYGDDWYRFLGSSRATLATESGSNVFDFDGALAESESETAGMGYEAFHANYLADREGRVRMNQVSPKIFEAISLRTALVCFEGTYSGVIEPDVHFIPLKKDFSNVDDVFAKLEDVSYLEALTERAYRDVIESGRYGYPAFMRRFDEVVERRIPRQPRAEIISAPILVRRRGSATYEAVPRREGFDYIVNDGVLDSGFNRRDLERVMDNAVDAQSRLRRTQHDRPPPDARTVWSAGPDKVVCYGVWANAGAKLESTDEGARFTTPAVAWSYTAGLVLDLGAVDFATTHCWVKVTVRDVDGPMMAGVYSETEDKAYFETPIPRGPGPGAAYVRMTGFKGKLLTFRLGDDDRALGATVLGVEVITASVWLPGVAELIAAARTQD